MRNLPFIDAHVHFWDLSHLRYDWLTPPFADGGPNGNVGPIARNYGPADYRAEAVRWNPVGVVHVEAGAGPAQSLAETDWLEGLAAGEGLPTGIVACACLDDPQVESLLAAQAERALVRGIRHIVNWHADPNRTYTPRDVTGDTAWARGFALLERHGLSFDLQAYPGQFPGLARLIVRHPGIPVIINHAGMGVELDAAGRAEWRAGMRALAALPNVSVKLSGLGFVWRPFDTGEARDRVRQVIDIFGADRVMVASDFPTDRLFASFDDTMDALAAAVADFTLDERRALFAGNANRVYRLGLYI
jgi:predicted TIM-barrel fold metal-dependent hydrolase